MAAPKARTVMIGAGPLYIGMLWGCVRIAANVLGFRQNRPFPDLWLPALEDHVLAEDVEVEDCAAMKMACDFPDQVAKHSVGPGSGCRIPASSFSIRSR